MLCYTGEPRNSGTNNWEITKRHIDGDQHVFDCFERIRDTAAAMREALTRGDWERDRRLPGDRMGEPQAPRARRHHAGDRSLIARATAAGAKAAKVCGAGGGGCLFCLAPPADVPTVREALADGGASILDFRIETTGLHVTRE